MENRNWRVFSFNSEKLNQGIEYSRQVVENWNEAVRSAEFNDFQSHQRYISKSEYHLGIGALTFGDSQKPYKFTFNGQLNPALEKNFNKL